jgi:hypothetical protein
VGSLTFTSLKFFRKHGGTDQFKRSTINFKWMELFSPARPGDARNLSVEINSYVDGLKTAFSKFTNIMEDPSVQSQVTSKFLFARLGHTKLRLGGFHIDVPCMSMVGNFRGIVESLSTFIYGKESSDPTFAECSINRVMVRTKIENDMEANHGRDYQWFQFENTLSVVSVFASGIRGRTHGSFISLNIHPWICLFKNDPEFPNFLANGKFMIGIDSSVGDVAKIKDGWQIESLACSGSLTTKQAFAGDAMFSMTVQNMIVGNVRSLVRDILELTVIPDP